MPNKEKDVAKNNSVHQKKCALIQAIAEKAFWSYAAISPSKISDEKLIEKVLVYGGDQERNDLLSIYSSRKVQRVWEQKLIIQEPRLHHLNRKLAVEYFHISNPEDHISNAYRKYNLYDRFSA
jgi:hypothetical protein